MSPTGTPQAGRDGDARITSDDQHLEVVAGGAGGGVGGGHGGLLTILGYTPRGIG